MKLKITVQSTLSIKVVKHQQMNSVAKKSMIFVQYACELNGGQARRQVEGLFVACVTVLVYFFSVVYFDYVKTVEETNFVDFDVKTITAGDYTMEFDLLKVDG
jgi:hypothetical protein